MEPQAFILPASGLVFTTSPNRRVCRVALDNKRLRYPCRRLQVQAKLETRPPGKDAQRDLQSADSKLSYGSAPEQPTGDHPSQPFSPAEGLDLVIHDVVRTAHFLRSFIRRKRAPSREGEDEDEDSTDSSASAMPTPSGVKGSVESDVASDSSYAPKSTIGARIAVAFSRSRGNFDRSMETISIRASAALSAAVGATGAAVSNALGAGHTMFPNLRLDKAQEAVQNAVSDKWSILSVFQWQLGSAKEASTRRKKRISQVSKFLENNGRPTAFGFLSLSLGNFARAIESLAPPAMNIVGSVSQKSIREFLLPSAKDKSSRKARTTTTVSGVKNAVLNGEPKVITHSATEEIKSPIASNQVSTIAYAPSQGIRRKSRVASKEKAKATRWRGKPVALSKEGRLDAASTSPQSSKPVKARRAPKKTKSFIPRPRITKAKTRKTVAKVIRAIQVAQRTTKEGNLNGKDILTRGAMVLGAGAVATAAAGAHLSAAVSCSALVVTSMAVANSRTVPASQPYKELTRKEPRSQSFKQLEQLYMQTRGKFARRARRMYVPRVDGKSVLTSMMRPAQLAQAATDTSPYTEEKQAAIFQPSKSNIYTTPVDVVETASYVVEESEPSILSAPVFGALLKWMDKIAFHAEQLFALVKDRLDILNPVSAETDEWVLLRSFTRNKKKAA